MLRSSVPTKPRHTTEAVPRGPVPPGTSTHSLIANSGILSINKHALLESSGTHGLGASPSGMYDVMASVACVQIVAYS